jgi:uncharacterized protein (TIGR03000 family)
MYSVVLVAALVTTSSATPNWHHRCGGCYVACSSCYCSGYGGYSGYSGHSGYSGYAYYPGYQPYTCHAGGGCYRTIPGYNGGYGWAGGCYGYHGGCYGAGYGASFGAGYGGPTVYGAYYLDPSQTYGQGCYGCYGGYAGYGIPVPPVVMPPAPTPSEGVKDPFPPINPDPKKKGEPIPAPKEKKVDPKKVPEKLSRATIRLEIPEGGKLFVDGQAIAVSAGSREFQTPPLAAGQRFFYDFRLEVVVHGEMRREERRVIVQANEELAIDFSRSPAIATR